MLAMIQNMYLSICLSHEVIIDYLIAQRRKFAKKELFDIIYKLVWHILIKVPLQLYSNIQY